MQAPATSEGFERAKGLTGQKASANGDQWQGKGACKECTGGCERQGPDGTKGTGKRQPEAAKGSLQRAHRGTQLPGDFLAQIRVICSNDIQVAWVSNVNFGPSQRTSAALLPVAQNHMSHLVVSLQPYMNFGHSLRANIVASRHLYSP